MWKGQTSMAISDVKGKFLVTGGSGFIGSLLVNALLKRGAAVKVLDVAPESLDTSNPNLELVGAGSGEFKGGMANKALVKRAIEDVEVIYHLAINWPWGMEWKQQPVADLFDTNVRGVLNLAEEAKTQGVGHFIFASSLAVYGAVDAPVIDEETVCKPELWNGDPGPSYAIMKLATEKLALSYHNQYRLPVTVFRIDVVFSNDQELFVTTEMMDKVRREEKIEAVEDEGSTSIHVNDVIEAFLLATLNPSSYGQVFNLTNPETYMSHYELCVFLAQIIGSNSRVKPVKAPKSFDSKFSIEKAQTLLGWNPRYAKDDRKAAIAREFHSKV